MKHEEGKGGVSSGLIGVVGEFEIVRFFWRGPAFGAAVGGAAEVVAALGAQSLKAPDSADVPTGRMKPDSAQNHVENWTDRDNANNETDDVGFIPHAMIIRVGKG